MARVAFWARAKAVGLAVLWLALFSGVGTGVTVLLLGLGSRAGVSWSGTWSVTATSLCAVAGFGFATWLVGHVLNRRAWAALGWTEPPRMPARLGGGLVLGLALAAAAVGGSIAVAGARVRPDADGGFVAAAIPVAAGLLTAALAEELMFRGYPLRRLGEALGAPVATVVLAVGFAAAHAGNPGVTALGTVNIALAAVLLSVAFFARGMPLAWGLHFGWNAGLALGFEAPVSGLTFDLPAVDYAPGLHAWLDGGAFGPEGGLVATVALAIGTVALAWRTAVAAGGAA